MTNLKRNLNPLIVGQDSQDSEVDSLEASKFSYSFIGVSGIVLFFVFALLPFFFGGRGLFANHIVKLVLFLSLVVSSVIFIFKKNSLNKIGLENETLSNKRSNVFLYFVPFLFYLIFQNISLPLDILGYFSEPAKLAYQKSNSLTGSISVDRSESVNALSWVFLYVSLYCLGLSVPYRKFNLKQKQRSSKISKNTVFFSKSSREYDLYSELIQKVVIAVSLFSAVIGVTHLMLQMQSLFGLFSFTDEYQFSWRAHWPFVNANQLAVMIEMGLMLSFARFLREKQLKTLSVSQKKEEGILKNIERVFYSLEKQALSLIVMFVLGIGLILTLSRAGIGLTFLGMSLVWMIYKFNPVVLISSDDRKRRLEKTNNSNISKLFSFLKISLFPLILFFFFLLYLGDDVSSRLSSRVDQTVSQNGDNSRKSLNQISWDVFNLNPLFGIGLNNWQYVAPQFSTDETKGWHLDYAHNDYLEVLSEIGLIGLLFACLPLKLALKNLLSLKGVHLGAVRKVYLCGLIMSFMVPAIHAFVDFPYHLPILSMGIFFLFLTISRSILFFQNAESDL
jgi:hypothetical protein